MLKNEAKTKKKIEEIYQRTLSELKALHQKKMALIRRYYNADNQKAIEKIRQEIKRG